MNLFSMNEKVTEKEPLAYRLRPETLEDFVGQEHILARDKILYRAIMTDTLTSLILYGPPGVGKTSLAKVISNSTKHKFYTLNAVTQGVQDIKDIVEETQNYMLNPSGKSILFVDEIHRFNKKQQDVLLPYVENGTIILIGATTENPYFEINKALISRSMVVKLNPLSEKDIVKIIKKALTSEKGFKNIDVEIEESLIEKIAQTSKGDVRYALQGLERAVLSSKVNSEGKIVVTEKDLIDSFQTKKMLFDKSGDEHYDNISAFIKSVRGSDPDAAMLYLARMLVSGEDPVFIARRLLILASEDIGLANPNALTLATSTLSAVKMIGMPEARIILGETTIYLALSPKSNTAYVAINKAIQDVKTVDKGEVPLHLRNAPVSQMKNEGYSIGYKYPHDYPNGQVEQEYLPNSMKNAKYYFDKWNIDKVGGKDE